MPAYDTLRFEQREKADPETGRRWIQLTSGDAYCYSIYYFEPTVTADCRYLLFYRYADDEIQNWRLDLSTGEAVRLTCATDPNCMWRFWTEDRPARGVRDLMSAFSPGSEDMLYFDGNALHAVHVRTLADRVAYELPPDRVPCGIPGASPDGTRFAFAHADRKRWEAATAAGVRDLKSLGLVRLDVVDLATGNARNLLEIDLWITHANWYDDERVLFGHMKMTDAKGGWYVQLRTGRHKGIITNHHIGTRSGVLYETCSPLPNGVIGICNPDTREFRDYLTDYPMHHVGYDREGTFWFGDVYDPEPPHLRRIAWLPRAEPEKVNAFAMLTGGFAMHGNAMSQRSHIHPVLLPDRKHILFTGPDERSRTNHLFLLDVADLEGAATYASGTP